MNGSKVSEYLDLHGYLFYHHSYAVKYMHSSSSSDEAIMSMWVKCYMYVLCSLYATARVNL